MNLGESIYRFRTERNMSQGDLADALEVSRQSVSKWENNSATPELEKLLKMSEVFGVTLDQLVGKEAPIPPAPESRAPEIPARQSISTHRILGIILLCFGLAAFLILTILGGIFLGFACSGVFIVIGIILMVCTDNLFFKCCWGIYAFYAPITFLFMLNMVGAGGFTVVIWLLVWLAVLLIWTIVGIRKGRLTGGSKKVVAGCILLVVVVCLILGIAMSPLMQKAAESSTEPLVDVSIEE